MQRNKETIEKQRETMKRKFASGELKIWNKGTKGKMKISDKNLLRLKLGVHRMKHSEDSKKKMRLAKFGKKQSLQSVIKRKLNNKGLFTKESRAKIIFPVKDTTIEVKIQNFLKQLGIEFMTHQYIKEIEHSYQCDILIPSMNLVIECDGNYWHKYPIGRDIDIIRTSELLQKGFKVLRLWEHEIKELDLNKFKEKLK